jgi:hypothetical protein
MTTPPNDDSELRGLLNDAVSDVHPERGPEEIHARARRRPSAARWLPLTVAAAVATVFVIGGAAWLAQRQPERTPAAGGGSVQANEDPAPTSTEPPTGGRNIKVLVYFVGQTATGPRLFSETLSLDNVFVSDLHAAALETLRAQPQDPDYTNPFRDLDLTSEASVANGVATIDLSSAPPRPAGMSEEEAGMAVQALVWSADAAVSGTGPVQFTLDGKPVDSLLGIDTSAPVERASGDSVLSPVSITTPIEGAKVSTQFEVKGQAAAFEANVVWELKRGNTVVRKGFTTAEQCCTLAPYAFTVTATPGDYTLVVHDTDESDGEGVGTSQDTKSITVE